MISEALRALYAAAAAAGFRMEAADKPGRFRLKSDSGQFLVDGVDLSAADPETRQSKSGFTEP